MKITSVLFKKSVIELTHELSPVKDVIKKPQFFFFGRSNVGKSSMINSLFWKKDLARTSAQAGKTRTINVFEVNECYECLDFPGYGYARGGREEMDRLREMILNYLEQSDASNVRIIQLIDAFVGPTAIDKEVYDYLWDKGASMLLVLNKADKANQKELQSTRVKIETDFAGTPYIWYSNTHKKFQDGALDAIFSEN